MDKCLVTKLGASVSGNFPKLGEAVFDISTVGITPTSSDFIRFYGTGIELRGGMEFSDSTTTRASGASGYLKADQTGQLVILNKYGITSMQITGPNTLRPTTPMELKEFSYNPGLISLVMIGASGVALVKGDISCFAGKALLSLRIDGNGNNITGNIDSFAHTFFSAVKNRSNIQQFSLRNLENVEGSIESLVAEIRALQYAAGESQTSGSAEFPFNISGTAVTFNGSTVASGTGMKLSWTASTITYNGVTINA
jgi:hypothetical protein